MARNGVAATKDASATSNAGTIVASSAQKIDALVAATHWADLPTHPSAAAVADVAKAREEIAAAKAVIAAGSGNSAATDKTALKKLNQAAAAIDSLFGAPASKGKMAQYSELNASMAASVALDNGATISIAGSLDVGNGYDFADDDSFDGRTAGSVSLDTIAIDFGAGGVLSLNDDGFAHLVDADDDEAADLMYTNTFGTASVSFVMDIDDGDSDTAARAAKWYTIGANKTVATEAPNAAFATNTATNSFVTTDASTDSVYYDAGAAADVQWSAKVSMPIAGVNVYAAADEEQGNAYGVSGTYMGIGWSVDSKREALAKAIGGDRSNTVKVSYTVDALTLGASYDSIKDGDQWGVSAAYAAGAVTLNLSTDEGSDWSA
jgi:hypothetical protein